MSLGEFIDLFTIKTSKKGGEIETTEEKEKRGIGTEQ